MDWADVILAVLKLVLSFTDWAKQRELITTAQAQGVLSYVEDWLADMRKVDAARDDAARRVPDPADPFNRDNDTTSGA